MNLTAEQSDALDTARGLALLGIPVFLALPDSSSSTGYRLPPRWQQTQADPAVVDTWRPGAALAAVMGCGLDLLDIDPRSGGNPDQLNGITPHSYAAAVTPSGGVHSFIRSLGVRSRDNVQPGIDVKAGLPDGTGRGFAFIAPTVRISKTSGQPEPYRWASKLDLLRLAKVLRGELDDDTGRNLARLVEQRHQGSRAPATAESWYDGPPFARLPAQEQQRLQAFVSTTVRGIIDDLDTAGDWPEGHTDERGRGWEKLQADAAWRLGRLARATWNDLELDSAEALFMEHAPTGGGWNVEDVEAKWAQQSRRGDPAPFPPSASDREAASWAALGFTLPLANPVAPTEAASTSIAAPPASGSSRALQDAYLAQTVATRALAGRYCWSGALGWMRYRSGCWMGVEEPHVHEVVRRDLVDQHAREASAGADAERLKRLSATLSASKIRGVVALSRGIVGVEAAAFDRHPNLLCVGNGVVDLATGSLQPHDPGLLLTKRTSVDYEPRARSTDWDAALSALPGDVVPWVQLRLGQAATGYRTSDDVLPVLQGSGSNGKTTLLGTVVQALGDHAVTIPERVLLAHPSDHPTELMTLRGARLAVIEETPEGRRLSTKRLKDTLGTPTMTARAIRRDNVTWDTTHSLFLTTNYAPVVAETDHGTWRRLALVRFPYTFTAPGQPADEPHKRPGLVGIRERLWEGRDGVHEAVLAWVVAGARAWFVADRVMPSPPPRVVEDTYAWRADSDLVLSYIAERLVIGAAAGDSHVMASDLFEDFTRYVSARGHPTWTEKTFAGRFAEHETVTSAGVEKKRMRPDIGSLSRPPTDRHLPVQGVPKQYTGWLGVQFRADDASTAVIHSVRFGESR